MKTLLLAFEGFPAAAFHAARAAGKLPALNACLAKGALTDLGFPLADARLAMQVSLLTGAWPDQHGILLGETGDPLARTLRPVVSADRTRPAVWELLDAQGLRCVSVGWPVAITGQTEHSAIVAAGFGLTPAPDFVPAPAAFLYPAALAEPLADCWLHPRDLDPAAISALIPRWAQVNLAVDSRPGLVGLAVAENVSRHAAFLELLSNPDWQFATLALSLPGELASLERASESMGDDLLTGLSERALPLLNAFLAAFLTRLPADANVVIVGTPHAETPQLPGFLLASGPVFVPARFPRILNVLQVAPLVWGAAGFVSPGLNVFAPAQPQRPLERSWRPPPDHQPARYENFVAEAAGFQKLPNEPLLPGEVWQLNSMSLLARSYLVRREPLAALPYLETLARTVPLNQSAQLLLSECREKLGLLAEALHSAYTAIHPLHGHNPVALLRAAELEALLGRREPARQLLQQAAPAIADYPQCRLAQANVLIFLRDWPAAAAILEVLVNEFPNDAYIRYRFGRCQVALHNWYGGFEQLMESLRLDPTSALTNELLGHCLLALGGLEQARAAFELAAAADPLWSRPRAMLVEVAVRLNRPAAEIAALKDRHRETREAGVKLRASQVAAARALIPA